MATEPAHSVGSSSTGPHIVATPDACGGKPRIDGTRIRVLDIYIWHELQRKSPDEIVNDFPQISMADVYAALAYFWDHRDEVRADYEQERREFESLKSAQPSRVAERRNELGTPSATDDSISS